jgi:flagellar hook capping protein|nr:flagellar hook capping FlgD N-terminal domain-containing protein [uncultured Selenomonas sp.]
MPSTNPLNTINVGGVTQKLADYEAAQNQAKAKDKNSNVLGKDAFLQLLVTQMKYQDPLDPQDNSEYLSQLAQFSALEQMTNVSKGLGEVSKIVENINSSVLIGQLGSMIGQPVQWMTEEKTADGQTVKKSYEGKIIGVSITDGQPSVIADVNGKTHQVQISKIVRIGRASAAP